MNLTDRDTYPSEHAKASQNARRGGCQRSDRDIVVYDALMAKRYHEVVNNLLPRVKHWICEHHRIAEDDAEELAVETIRRVGMKVQQFDGHCAFFSWIVNFCVFHPNPITDSDFIRSPIPTLSDH